MVHASCSPRYLELPGSDPTYPQSRADLAVVVGSFLAVSSSKKARDQEITSGSSQSNGARALRC